MLGNVLYKIIRKSYFMSGCLAAILRTMEARGKNTRNQFRNHNNDPF